MNDSDYYKNKSREELIDKLIDGVIAMDAVTSDCKVVCRICGCHIKGKQTTHKQDCLKLIASRIKALR